MLKFLEHVKHIKLLFFMSRKIFDNSPRGLKTSFNEFKNEKGYDEKIKRFRKSAESFVAC